MSATEEDSINIRFHNLCTGLLTWENEEVISQLSRALEDVAIDLAKDEGLRTAVGADQPTIWPNLRGLWLMLADKVATHRDDEPTRAVVISTSRFTRNLVAGVAKNQENAFENEPELRQILHIYSSWTASQNPGSLPVVRMVVQTLSNMVTTNEGLMSRLWQTHMNLPEEQAEGVEFTGPPGNLIAPSIIVFLRALLVKTRIGVRLCITLLDRMTDLHDAEESSDAGRAFDYGYHLFSHLFSGGFAPDLFGNLKVDGEVIVPHQTILLKLLDSYLQSSPSETLFSGMTPMLITCFFKLSQYAIGAIKDVVGSEQANVIHENGIQTAPNPMLPKVCEALVLVSQSIASIMLASEATHLQKEVWPLFRESVSSDGRVVAEDTVELLRLLDIFLPKVNFGRPVMRPGRQEHPCSAAVADPTGFLYLKRDLVRLIGILCQGDKATQDRIRQCDGIPVIMNMCVIDERNPYLREHAILTLHNLLEGNRENQDVVHSIQPSRTSLDELELPCGR
ncbi:spinocerebellar ataxia type 10 protein domain-containing protein [Pisolithus albus]|nr:spinocerebellar ataxia type 10 protein domain-containing protein [Pisolithus albus]